MVVGCYHNAKIFCMGLIFVNSAKEGWLENYICVHVNLAAMHVQEAITMRCVNCKIGQFCLFSVFAENCGPC